MERDNKILTFEQIKEILPHRSPFLLIDRVTNLEPGKSAEAIKCISGNEPFFQGHFPEKAVMPGVLILEALAQTGAVAILSMDENRGKLAFFGGVKNCRFRRQVVPGEQLQLRCTLTRMRGTIGFGDAEAWVEGELAVKAEISFAVTSV